VDKKTKSADTPDKIMQYRRYPPESPGRH